MHEEHEEIEKFVRFLNEREGDLWQNWKSQIENAVNSQDKNQLVNALTSVEHRAEEIASNLRKEQTYLRVRNEELEINILKALELCRRCKEIVKDSPSPHYSAAEAVAAGIFSSHLRHPHPAAAAAAAEEETSLRQLQGIELDAHLVAIAAAFQNTGMTARGNVSEDVVSAVRIFLDSRGDKGADSLVRAFNENQKTLKEAGDILPAIKQLVSALEDFKKAVEFTHSPRPGY